MLQGEHSAILLTFIKLPFVIKIFVLSIFEWLFYTGFTALFNCYFSISLGECCISMLDATESAATVWCPATDVTALPETTADIYAGTPHEEGCL